MPCTLQFDQPPVEQAWLIPEVLPQGELVLLDGPHGVGKSCLAAALAADISLKPHQGKEAAILYLPSKLQRPFVATFLNRQEINFDAINELKYQSADPEQSQLEPLLSSLEATIEEQKPALVVIDSLEEFLEDDAHTDARAWTEFWTRLRALAHACNSTILIPRRHGMHENRQYGPITRTGSEIALFILTMHYHPIDPAERIVTVAKHQTGLIGHQAHARFTKNKLHLHHAEPHQHVRPARAPATWQPKDKQQEEINEILEHVESYMMGTVTPKKKVKEYVLESGFSERAYNRAMRHIKLECKRLPGSNDWHFLPTAKMESRSLEAQQAPIRYHQPAETPTNQPRAQGAAVGGPQPVVTKPTPRQPSANNRQTG